MTVAAAHASVGEFFPRDDHPRIQTVRRTLLLRRVALCLAVAGVAALGALAAPESARAVEPAPAPLQVTRGAASVTVRGGHFELTWSATQGGDLRSIRLHDGIEWHELVGQGARRSSVPGLLLYTEGGTMGPFGPGALEIREASPERVIVVASSHPATEDRKPGDLELVETFTVYPEGAVFVDLDLSLPAGKPAVTLDRASLGWPVDTSGYSLAFWHWQRNLDRGSGMLDPQLTFTSPFAPNAGLALGNAGNLTNQLQVTLESSHQIGSSDIPVTTMVKDGKHFISWLRSEQAGPALLRAPFHDSNRWGFFLGRRPQRSRLAGHRLAYWIEGGEGAMAFPSASAVGAMARCGATGIVLGEGWRRAGGRDGNVPVDEAAFAAFVTAAHGAGLRALATVYPGGDGEALGRWARAAGLDGLYLEQASAHYGAIRDGDLDFAARATFLWGKALRHGLGPDGLLIVHPSLEAPDLTLGLLADGIAFGTERAEWRAARSTLASAYLGGAGAATPCPLGLEGPMQTARAAAIAASTGAVPLVALGYGPNRSAYAGARWALPLWQLLRLVEPGPEADFRPPGARAAAVSSNTDFWTCAYRLSDTEALLVAANLSVAERDSTTFALDYAALGFDGEYGVEEVNADSLATYAVRFLGRSQNGRIRTGPIPRFGLRGYLFASGEHSAATARALDEGLQLASTPFSRRPPPAVGGLRVAPVTLGLELAWEPLGDRQHVVAYRIYRSPDPGFSRPGEVVSLGETYEETRYRDLAVSPGDAWSYAVTAVDVAGHEGRPSAAASGMVEIAAGARSWAFGDSAGVADFVPLTGTWAFHDSAYGHSCVPDGSSPARSLLAGVELADVDLAVKIESPGESPYAGGLLCRADGKGAGYALLLGDPRESSVVLARLGKGAIEPLATAYFPYLRPGASSAHTLRLVARGPELAGYLDDRPLVAATDSTFARGRVGLVAMKGHVHFDNLVVAAPPAPR